MNEKQLPLISIAMTTYNGERFLKEQLDSIFAQTYPNIELIVCDDCSQDNTLTILKEYAKKHSNMKVYQNEESLLCVKNFEKAIRLCSADYIALADQDDIWEANKLTVLMSEIGHYSLVFSDAVLIDDVGYKFHDSHVRYSGRATKSKSLEFLIFNNIAQGCATLFKREILAEAIPFGHEDIGQDWHLTVAAIYKNGIKYVDLPLIRYRQHSQNYAGAGHRLRFFKLYDPVKLKSTMHRVNLSVEWLLASELSLSAQERHFLTKCLKYSKRPFSPLAIVFWIRIFFKRML